MKTTTDLDSWLATMPPREEIEAAIKRHQAEIQRYQQVLRILDSSPLQPTGEGSPENATPSKPSLRQAVMAVVETGQPGKRWRLHEIRKDLVQRGHLRADERGRHDLQNIMIKMVRRGEVVRPKTGVYALPKTGRSAAQPTS